MANTKISQLPSWTGTAADLRWFVMNNSGENETFKFSGYTSPFKQADNILSIVPNYLPGSRATGNYSLVGGEGTTTSNDVSSIVWGKNLNVINGGEPGKAIFGSGNSSIGGGNNMLFGSGCINNGYYSIAGGEGVNNYGNSNATFGRSQNNSGGRGFMAGNQNTISDGTGSMCAGNAHQMATNGGYDSYNSIWGGDTNKLNYSMYSQVVGGRGNNISGATSSFSDFIYGSSILGGSGNTISGMFDAIVGGRNNTIKSNTPTTYGYSAILGGYNNQIGSFGSRSSRESTIIGGRDNSIIATFDLASIHNSTSSTIDGGAQYQMIVNSSSGSMDGAYYSNLFGTSNTFIKGGQYLGVFNSNDCDIDGYGQSQFITIFGSNETKINQAYPSDGGFYKGGWASNGTTLYGNGEYHVAMATKSSSVNTTGNYVAHIATSGCSTTGSTEMVVMLGTKDRTATRSNATFVENLVLFNYSNLNYSGDTAAAAGGVVLGQVYHDNGTLRVRIV